MSPKAQELAACIAELEKRGCTEETEEPPRNAHTHVLRLFILDELRRRDPAEQPKFEAAFEEAFDYFSELEFKASIVDNAPVVEPPPCQP